MRHPCGTKTPNLTGIVYFPSLFFISEVPTRIIDHYKIQGYLALEKAP